MRIQLCVDNLGLLTYRGIPDKDLRRYYYNLGNNGTRYHRMFATGWKYSEKTFIPPLPIVNGKYDLEALLNPEYVESCQRHKEVAAEYGIQIIITIADNCSWTEPWNIFWSNVQGVKGIYDMNPIGRKYRERWIRELVKIWGEKNPYEFINEASGPADKKQPASRQYFWLGQIHYEMYLVLIKVGVVTEKDKGVVIFSASRAGYKPGQPGNPEAMIKAWLSPDVREWIDQYLELYPERYIPGWTDAIHGIHCVGTPEHVYEFVYRGVEYLHPKCTQCGNRTDLKTTNKGVDDPVAIYCCPVCGKEVKERVKIGSGPFFLFDDGCNLDKDGSPKDLIGYCALESKNHYCGPNGKARALTIKELFKVPGLNYFGFSLLPREIETKDGRIDLGRLDMKDSVIAAADAYKDHYKEFPPGYGQYTDPDKQEPGPGPEPEYVEVQICPESGILANEYCPIKTWTKFEKGKEPMAICGIHKKPEEEKKSEEPQGCLPKFLWGIGTKEKK